MEYNKALLLMDEIGKYHKGIFEVNGDYFLTRQIKRILETKYSNRFDGTNNVLQGKKLYVTSGDYLEDGTIQVNPGAIVYGPYYQIPKGDYKIIFNTVEKASLFRFSVENCKVGIIAQAEKGKNEVVLTLDTDLTDIEFKTYNTTSSVLHLTSVTVAAMIKADAVEQNPVVENNTDNADPKKGILEDTRIKFKKVFERFNILQRYRNLRIKLFNLENGVNHCNVQLSESSSRIDSAEREMESAKGEITQLHKERDDLYKIIDDIKTQIETEVQSELNKIRDENKALAEELKRSTDEAFLEVREDQKGIRGEFNDLQRNYDSFRQEVSREIEKDRLAEGEQINEIWERIKEYDSFRQEVPLEIQRSRVEEEKKIDEIWEKIKEIDKTFAGVWDNQNIIHSELNNLWRNNDSFRQEVFYEINAAANNKKDKPTRGEAVQEPIVKSDARIRIEQERGAIRLNLGSGTLSVEGYLSVDARDMQNIDIVADVSNLPFQENEVDEIYSAHLIEHFTKNQMRNELLPYWYSLLKKGGIFTVIFPDLQEMIKAYSKGEISFEQLGYIIMGAQDYTLDYHYAVYSADIVSELLAEAGFQEIEVVAKGRTNGQCLETEITARKREN